MEIKLRNWLANLNYIFYKQYWTEIFTQHRVEYEEMNRIFSDQNTTLFELRQAVDKFVKDREWGKYHTLKDLAISIVIESSELLEQFQWVTADEVDEFVKKRKKVAEIEAELADILIYCMNLSNVLDVDLSQLITRKLRENERKYPVSKVKGSYRKYTEIKQ